MPFIIGDAVAACRHTHTQIHTTTFYKTIHMHSSDIIRLIHAANRHSSVLCAAKFIEWTERNVVFAEAAERRSINKMENMCAFGDAGEGMSCIRIAQNCKTVASREREREEGSDTAYDVSEKDILIRVRSRLPTSDPYHISDRIIHTM